MYYLLYGNDTNKARAKLRSLTASLQAKREGSTLWPLGRDSVTVGQLEELAMSQSLFDQKYLVSADNILTIPEVEAWVKANLALLADSPHIFIFLEEKVPAVLLKKLEQKAEKVQEFSLPDRGDTKASNKNSFNIFALTDSLGARDRRQLWVNYQAAIHYNLAAEEIFWKLTWQVKNLLLVKTATKVAALGLKPFMLSKLSGYAKNFSLAELQDLSANLVRLYHDARRGLVEFDIALEQLILNI